MVEKTAIQQGLPVWADVTAADVPAALSARLLIAALPS